MLDRPGTEPTEPSKPQPSQSQPSQSQPSQSEPQRFGPGGPPAVDPARSAAGLTPRERLRNAFLRPQVSRAQLTAALLLAVLGFGVAIQVRSTNANTVLRGARQSDLIRILDDVSDRSARLEEEKRALEVNRDQLLSGSDRSKAALRQTEERQRTLGILAGTLPAQGPGIELTITDPRQEVDAAVLLDALQELRDAKAEVVQINDRRVVASTHFVDEGKGRIRLDDAPLAAPYRLKVIGDPATLSSALRIPGGVLEVLKGKGAGGAVLQRPDVRVDALQPPRPPRYARPA
jgi:uncharacterized protein YlxW (UPF0749 family)